MSIVKGGPTFNVLNEKNYIVTSNDRGKVRRLNSDGTTVWTTQVAFGSPSSLLGLKIDYDDNVIVGSQNPSGLHKLDSNGNILWQNTSFGGLVHGVAVDTSNNIYTAVYDSTVRKFNPNGTQIWSYSFPSGVVYSVAVDNTDGSVYAAGSDSTVRKLNSSGALQWTFTGHAQDVWDVIVDENGHIYTSGLNDQTVRKITTAGTQVWSYNTGATNFGIATDINGNVYVGSQDTNLRKLNASGVLQWTFTGHTGGLRRIAVDTTGEFVYTSSLDRTTRKINSSGTQVWSVNFGQDFHTFATAISPLLEFEESTIQNMYLGSTVIPRAYFGGTLVFGTTPPSAYELIADINVATATTQIDFDNLNITKDDELRLVYTLVGAINNPATYRLFVNNNTTNNNYWWQQLTGTGSTLEASRANENIVSVGWSQGKSSGFVDIKISNNDRFVYQSQFSQSIGSQSSSIVNRNFNVVGTFNISSINNLIFASTSTQIGVGSRLQLYKVNKGSA